jgi:hypothetical protein
MMALVDGHCWLDWVLRAFPVIGVRRVISLVSRLVVWGRRVRVSRVVSQVLIALRVAAFVPRGR